MLIKIKSLFSKPIPLPRLIDKILHARIPILLSVIIIVIVSLPIIVLVLSYFIFYILLTTFDYLIYFLPPYPEKISYLGLFVVVLASYAIMLPLYWWFKRIPSVKIVKLASIILLVELILYFWYTAWWTDYMYHYGFGGFEDFGIENRLDIILVYTKALFKTVIIGIFAIVAHQFLKNNK